MITADTRPLGLVIPRLPSGKQATAPTKRKPGRRGPQPFEEWPALRARLPYGEIENVSISFSSCMIPRKPYKEISGKGNMTRQFSFFGGTKTSAIEGLHYGPELISAQDERRLVEHVRVLPFREFEFHGYLGKRRVVSFGWRYDFSGSKLQKADDVPEFLLPLRAKAAAFAGLEPDALQHVLVTEYGLGSGIGWHRDKAVFGEVVGVSLLASCTLRFRRKVDDKWERANLHAEPRSAYHLSGPARSEWQHSILRVDALRYSITFRNVLASAMS